VRFNGAAAEEPEKVLADVDERRLELLLREG
jgi:hypothetical protein